VNPDIARVLLPGDTLAPNSGASKEPSRCSSPVSNRNGLLSAPRGAKSDQYWSPLIRDVIHDDFATRNPRLALELEARLAEWFAANEDQELALFHAVNARRWDLFVTYVGIQPLTVSNMQWSNLISAFGAVPVDSIVPDSTAATPSNDRSPASDRPPHHAQSEAADLSGDGRDR